MTSISQIESFIAVVKQGSFIDAANSMGMTGPAMSKKVKALEFRLGVKLLHRTTRMISLTEEGKIYYLKATKAINDLVEAEQELLDAKDCPTGPLRVSLPVTFGLNFLTQSLAKFALKYPEVKLEVLFDDRRADLYEENIDAAIRIGSLSDSSLIAKQLHHCPVILCASPSFLNNNLKITGPSDIANLPGIIFNRHSNEGLWRYQSPAGENGSVKLKQQFISNTAEMMVEACVTGIGISLIPIFSCAKYLATGKLVQVLPDHKTLPQSNIYVLYKNRSMSTRLKLFIEAIEQCCKALPW